MLIVDYTNIQTWILLKLSIVVIVMIDSHSKWLKVIPLKSTTTTMLISSLSHIFSTHGLPKTIVIDNGTKFSWALFRDFCQSHNITYIYSSPYHSQSNDSLTLKRTFQKSRGEGTTGEIINALQYRMTSHPALNYHSPTVVHMERRPRRIQDTLILKSSTQVYLHVPRWLLQSVRAWSSAG